MPPDPSPEPPSQHQQSHDSSWSLSSVVSTFGLPCLIGVAAIDPGNLEVDLQAGASLQYTLLWILLLSSVLGAILQTLSAHLPLCTGYHLSQLCPRLYSRHPVLLHLLFALALLSVLAFDVAEVVGTAVAITLLIPVPLWIAILLSALDTLLVLFLQRKRLTAVHLIVETLLLLLAFCLIYEFILSTPSLPQIAQGLLLPSFGPDPSHGVILAVAIIGSVIMSHNLFLHSWLQYHRTPPSLFPSTTLLSFKARCRHAQIEAALIFFATFLINACVLIVVAASLPADLVHSLPQVGLSDAGLLLQRVLGHRFASTAWALALLASGHAATVTGALACQAICEGFLQQSSSHLHSSSSAIVLASRFIAIVPAVAVALLVGESGADSLALISQTLLSFAMPFAAVPLFKVLNAVAAVSPAYSRAYLNAGYVVFSVVMAANLYAIWQVARDVFSSYGFFPLFMLSSLVAFFAVALVKLILTPVHLADFALLSDHCIPGGPEGQSLVRALPKPISHPI